jgi:hypothetical protein
LFFSVWEGVIFAGMKYISELIQNAIFELNSKGCRTENIKITTSFVIQRLIEKELVERFNFNLANLNNIFFGASISFDHFANEIVVYDKNNACLREDFKIVIHPA